MDFVLLSQSKQKNAALSPQFFLLSVKSEIHTSIKPAIEGGFFRIIAGRYDART